MGLLKIISFRDFGFFCLCVYDLLFFGDGKIFLDLKMVI